MGVPMVTCAICNAQITKRSSMLIEPYGRICRSHPEVETHKAKLAEIAKQQSENKNLEKALQGMQVMVLAEQLRMMAFTSGYSLEVVMFAYSNRMPQSIRADVEKRVRELGPLTPKEFHEAIDMAAYLASQWHLQPA